MRILWLKSELLHPVDKGGRIRTYHMLRHLKREHEVTYLAPVSPADGPAALEQAAEYCHRLLGVPAVERPKSGGRFYGDLARNLASPLPYALAKYRSPVVRRAIEGELGRGGHDLVVCDFLVPSVNLGRRPPVPAVLFEHNIEAMIWRRQFATQRDWLKKAYFFHQWRRMLRYERAACRRFDAVVAVSREDRDVIHRAYGVDQVYDVPTGVDTQYFRPPAEAPEPFRLVFTGSMDWLPNEDGILHFAEHILPRVAAELPEVSLTVVGRNPSARLRRLSGRCPRLALSGRVDDVRPYMARAAAYVVPLRVGGGTRLKIYEAMAMGKPVVSTRIGAEGLPVRDGQELLIADRPEDFARAVVWLLTDAAAAEQIGRRARAAVCERFGWDRAAAAFARVCERVVADRGAGGGGGGASIYSPTATGEGVGS